MEFSKKLPKDSSFKIAGEILKFIDEEAFKVITENMLEKLLEELQKKTMVNEISRKNIAKI